MKTKKQSFCKALFLKIALLTALILGGGSSAWADELTIANVVTKGTYVPFYTSALNSTNGCGQFIIDADSLSSIIGSEITGLIFYCDNYSTLNFNGATHEVYLKEVDNKIFSSAAYTDWGGLDKVFSGTLSISTNMMTITFDNSFNYSGKNLLVGFKQTAAASKNPTSAVNWYAKTMSTDVGVSYTWSMGLRKLLPKTTIVYTPAGCPKPTSPTVSSITYNSATFSWTSSADNWQVYYSSTEGEPDEEDVPAAINTKTKSLTGLTENTTYYCYVRTYCDASNQSDWASTSFTTPEQYPRPTDFELTGFTATSATFDWTVGSDETAWKLSYSTDAGFTPGSEEETITTVDVTTRPYTLSGLTENVHYYGYLCANYGTGRSVWVGPVQFTPTDETDLTIFRHKNTDNYIPISGLRTSSMMQTQTILPSDSLTDIQGRQITKLKFYSSSTSVNWGNATFEVYMKETSNKTYASATPEIWGTNVMNASALSIDANGEMEIVLAVPFNYQSNSLLIGVKQKVNGSTSNIDWYGKSGSYTSYYAYGSSTGRESFSPKVTITSIPANSAYVKIGATGYTTFASSWPLDLSNLPSGLTAYYVASGDVDGSVAYLTPITTSVAAGTGLILKGTANTTYAIPVAASGSDISGSNLMVGVTPLETALAENETSGYDNYVLVNNSGTPQFQSLSENGATIPGGKAYLRNGEYSGESRALSIIFGNEGTTGIVSHNRETVTTQRYYNLQGQRITKPQKGINIVNGKKMIIK